MRLIERRAAEIDAALGRSTRDPVTGEDLPPKPGDPSVRFENRMFDYSRRGQVTVTCWDTGGRLFQIVVQDTATEQQVSREVKKKLADYDRAATVGEAR